MGVHLVLTSLFWGGEGMAPHGRDEGPPASLSHTFPTRPSLALPLAGPWTPGTAGRGVEREKEGPTRPQL